MNKALGWIGACALFGLLAVGGCGDQPTNASANARGTGKKKLRVGIVFDKGGRGDKSFNDSAWRGIERAKAEFDIEERAVESKAEKDYEPNLTALADQGVDVIVAVGLAMKDSVQGVAPNYPNVKFALVDDVVDAPNVRSLLFKEEEGSFLAGYLAGLMTTADKIGFVGGMEIDLIKKFYAGYAAGAKSANPAIEILPEKYTGDWNNVDTGKVAANVLFRSGADIVYHAAGKAGLGVIAAAQDNKKLAIGVDSDQDYIAPGFVLTSMIKRVDEAVYQTIKDVVEGKWSPGTVVYDLKAGGVGISELKYTKDRIGEEKLKRVREVGDRISSGELKVPSTKADLDRFLQTLAQ